MSFAAEVGGYVGLLLGVAFFDIIKVARKLVDKKGK